LLEKTKISSYQQRQLDDSQQRNVV